MVSDSKQGPFGAEPGYSAWSRLACLEGEREVLGEPEAGGLVSTLRLQAGLGRSKRRFLQGEMVLVLILIALPDTTGSGISFLFPYLCSKLICLLPCCCTAVDND